MITFSNIWDTGLLWLLYSWCLFMSLASNLQICSFCCSLCFLHIEYINMCVYIYLKPQRWRQHQYKRLTVHVTWASLSTVTWRWRHVCAVCHACYQLWQLQIWLTADLSWSSNLAKSSWSTQYAACSVCSSFRVLRVLQENQRVMGWYKHKSPCSPGKISATSS